MYMNPTQKKLTPFQRLEQEIRRSEMAASAPRTKSRALDKMDINRSRRNKKVAPSDYVPNFAPTDDDLAPEILIHEDGARSPYEEGDDFAMDETYEVVDANRIGAGFGLDEAELADIDPLDEKI